MPSLTDFRPGYCEKINVGIIGYGWAAAFIGAINATGMAQVTNVYSSRLLDDDELSARHGGRIKSTVNLKDIYSDQTSM